MSYPTDLPNASTWLYPIFSPKSPRRYAFSTQPWRPSHSVSEPVLLRGCAISHRNDAFVRRRLTARLLYQRTRSQRHQHYGNISVHCSILTRPQVYFGSANTITCQARQTKPPSFATAVLLSRRSTFFQHISLRDRVYPSSPEDAFNLNERGTIHVLTRMKIFTFVIMARDQAISCNFASLPTCASWQNAMCTAIIDALRLQKNCLASAL